MLLYSLRLSDSRGWSAQVISAVWVLCLAIIVMILLTGCGMPEDRRVYSKLITFCRGIPLLLLVAGVRFMPVPPANVPDGEAEWGEMIWVGVIFLTLLVAVPWITQFSQFEVFKNVRDPFIEKLRERASAWFDENSTAESALKLENGVDIAFASFAALALNAYTLLSGLRSPGWFVLVYVVSLLALFGVWGLILEVWRLRTMATGTKFASIVPGVVVLVAAFFLLVPNVALDSISEGTESTPSDSGTGNPEFYWSDFGLFGVKVLILTLTTALPYIAARMYKRVIRVNLTPEGFAFTKRGEQYLEVDQKTHILRWQRGVAPKYGQRVYLSILDGSDEYVNLFIRFKTRGRGDQKRLVYDYSVLYEGKYFYVQGLEDSLRRKLIIIRNWLDGRGTVRPASMARYKVESGAIPPSEEGIPAPTFCMVALGVPPLLPDAYR